MLKHSFREDSTDLCENRALAETGIPRPRRRTMNFRMGRWPYVIGVLLAPQAAYSAQNPADAPPPETFRTGIELVQVRVIAEDKDGKPVTDLRQDEFRVLDNGVQQDIRVFLNESERSSVASPPLPPGTFTNRGASRAGEHSGYSVIVLDTLLTLLADENHGGSGTIWAIQKAARLCILSLRAKTSRFTPRDTRFGWSGNSPRIANRWSERCGRGNQ